MSLLRKRSRDKNSVTSSLASSFGDLGGSFRNYDNNFMNGSSTNGMDQSERLQQQQKRRRKKNAWKRQRRARREAKVVQKSAGHVAKIVTDLTEGRIFLRHTPDLPIAKFHRSEIVVGNLLGRGVFARVYDVKDFDLHDVEEDDDERKLIMEPDHPQQKLKPKDQLQLLQRIQESEPTDMNALVDRPLSFGKMDAISENGENGENGSETIHSVSQETATTTGHTTPSLTETRDPAFSSSRAINESITAPSSVRNRSTHRFNGSVNQSHILASRRAVEPAALRLQARNMLREGKKHYALKHLTKSLLRNPKNFYLAAAALLVEAKYLSKLKHPNIVKVVGLAMTGEAAENDSDNHRIPDDAATDFSRRVMSTRNGIGGDGVSTTSVSQRGDGHDGSVGDSQHHDSYFLISERLTDTLERRIRQWRREQPTQKKLAEQSSRQKIQTWKHMMRKTSYALQIANALAYLHQRKLLYRDLKPSNIGFIGDNETICLINFGLCREVDPETGEVEEDEVTALFGAQSWKYTAVECSPQPVVHSTGELLASASLVLQQSSRSSLWDSLSGSFHGKRDTRHTKMDPQELNELERELQVVHEQYRDELGNEHGSVSSAPQAPTNSLKRGLDKSIRMVKQRYDVKVDVYGWAMVYYEMLTLNQPFLGMSQKEYLRKVAGPKGGQRPGVYQFDLTPSIISLLQRAWDQSPSKRPTMESVGRNLQLILKELEELIGEEQKAMLRAGTIHDSQAIAKDRTVKRAKRKEDRERRKQERQTSKASKKKTGSVMQKGKATFTGMFVKNQYRASEVREALASPSNVFGPLSEATEAAVAAVTGPASRISGDSNTEVDIAALDYEELSMGERSDSSSSSSEYNDASLSADDNISNKEISIIPHVDSGIAGADENHETVDKDDRNVIDDAISALQASKKRTIPDQDRKMSSGSTHSGASSSIRRREKSKASKSRNSGGMLSERRGTHRMSRRTMRLSRASVWMMRRDFRILAMVLAVMTVSLLARTSIHWFFRRRASWLGIDLRTLKQEKYDDIQLRKILMHAIHETCAHEDPQEYDPSKPMLFQGGALSRVDLKCTESLERQLDDKIAWVTGTPNGLENHQQYVGFLNMYYFDKPPPQRKKSKYRRKKTWKFFRDAAASKTSACNPSSVTSSKSLKEHLIVPETARLSPGTLIPTSEDSVSERPLPTTEV